MAALTRAPGKRDLRPEWAAADNSQVFDVRQLLRALLWWAAPWSILDPRDPMRTAREFTRDADLRLKTLAMTEIELARDDERR